MPDINIAISENPKIALPWATMITGGLKLPCFQGPSAPIFAVEVAGCGGEGLIAQHGVSTTKVTQCCG